KNMSQVILILDKVERIGVDAVALELERIGLSSSTVQSIKQFLLSKDNTNLDYSVPFADQNQEVRQGLEELKELEYYINYLDMINKCMFNPFLASGLEIYTGTIYEIFLSDKTLKSSVGSGGRYDNAIAGLIGTKDPSFSTVGISFGLDVIYAALNKANKNIIDNSFVDYYVIPMNTPKESRLVANYLRNQGYKVELEMGNKKVGKALNKANKDKINNVIIVGENEVKNNVFKIKNMISGEERAEPFIYRE